MKTQDTINKNFLLYLKKNFNFINYYIIDDEIFIVLPYNNLFNFITFLKYNTFCQFKTLVDITAVDHPNRQYRFELNYSFLSYNYNTRLNVVTYVQNSLFVDSITPLFKSAN